jgi:D-3-phosphoglycerate dehydrogenase
MKKLAADVEGIILRTNIHLSCEIMDAAPNLKIISRTGVGINNVDVEAATEKKIMVCNTPGVNAVSVAEQTIALMMALAKQLKPMGDAMVAGNWEIRNSYKAMDIDGKTIGLLGLGQIGRMVAEKCRHAFNMNVIAYDPYVQQGDGIDLYDDLESVFSQADVVSIHVPYVKETHHLVNAKLLSLMRPTAFLINTARGSIVDEKALIEALEKGAIAGAGLDVFEQEPPLAENPLFKMNNVISTPHSAALSAECVARVVTEAAQAIVDVFSGQEPKFIYNRNELSLGD